LTAKNEEFDLGPICYVEQPPPEKPLPSYDDEEVLVHYLLNNYTEYRAERSRERYARFDGCIYNRNGFLVAQYEVKQIGGKNKIREPLDDQILNYGKWCESLSTVQITRTEIIFFFRYIGDPSGQYRIFPISRAVMAPNKYRVIHLNAVTASSSGPKVLIPKDEMITISFPASITPLKTLLDKTLQH